MLVVAKVLFGFKKLTQNTGRGRSLLKSWLLYTRRPDGQRVCRSLRPEQAHLPVGCYRQKGWLV